MAKSKINRDEEDFWNSFEVDGQIDLYRYNFGIIYSKNPLKFNKTRIPESCKET